MSSPILPETCNRTSGSMRAYVLLQADSNRCNDAVTTLKRQPGVVSVDRVEGPPDIVVLLEARDRSELASILIAALSSVEGITEGVDLLPTLDKKT